jgi:acylphosphatase
MRARSPARIPLGEIADAQALVECGLPAGRQALAVADSIRAMRFYVSGSVQGVGYRFFAQLVAARLGVHGYVKNLFDGRVEVYAMGTDEQLREMRRELKRGPRGASVEEVGEDAAEMLPEYSKGFSIEYER